MNKQNLIVYQFNTLLELLKELEENLNFKIVEAKNENSLKEKINISKKYIIITKKKLLGKDNQIVMEKFPIKLNKLIEKLNIQSLKQQFNDQSEIKIKNYLINLNSREMTLNNLKLRLTEKEVNTIIYLSKIEKPTTVEELESKVWGYQPDIETHTVETHIYRLRKKILKTFSDKNFINSKKNGYQIN
tara:strand:+ start:262 stop:825 length:564 start_codon:yes stop_codon:yes gene_type:complete